MPRRDTAEIVETIARYRGALRRADRATVEALTDFRGRALEDHGQRRLVASASARRRTELLEAFEDHERSVLSAELPQLARRWRDAESRVTAVRWIGDDEAEAYESVTLRGVSFELVSHLVRDGRWRIRRTSVARDREVAVLLPLRERSGIDPDSFAAQFRDEWRVRAAASMVADELWIATNDVTIRGAVGGPRPALRAWPGATPSAHVGCLELAVQLDNALGTRIAQLTTLAMVATTLAARRATRVVLRDLCKVYAHDEIRRAVQRAQRSLAVLAALWLDVVFGESILFTSGLSRFGRPELEVRGHFDTPGDAAAILARLAILCAVDDVDWAPGDVLRLDGRPTFRIGRAPRGPTPNRTYGRFGALALEPLEQALGN